MFDEIVSNKPADGEFYSFFPKLNVCENEIGEIVAGSRTPGSDAFSQMAGLSMDGASTVSD